MVHPRQTPMKNSIPEQGGSGVKKAVMLTPADRVKRMQDAKRIYNDLSRKSVKLVKPPTPLSERQEEAAFFDDDDSHAIFTEPQTESLPELQSTLSPASGLQDGEPVESGSPPPIKMEENEDFSPPSTPMRNVASSSSMGTDTTGRLSIAPTYGKSIATGGSTIRLGRNIAKPIRPGVKPPVFKSLSTPAPQASEESFVPATSVTDFRINTPHKGRVSKMTVGGSESSAGRPSTTIATIRTLVSSAQENDNPVDPARRMLCFDDESEIYDASEATAESSSNCDHPEPEVRVVKPVTVAHSATQTSAGLSAELISKSLATYTREDFEALRDAMPSPQKKIWAEVFPCEKPTEKPSSSQTGEVSLHPSKIEEARQEAAPLQNPDAPPMVDTPKSRFPRRSMRIAELKSPGLAFADQEATPTDKSVTNSNKKKRGGSRSRDAPPADELT
ncbi:hypothetical protein AAVH_04823 [Aphelenchoides avenae]|nr:hypothetical protein AAVH_04823 [Aphelenchus avenae]